MTTQPENPATEEKRASEFTKPVRDLLAFVLLGANAVLLFFAVVDLLIPYDFDPRGFTGRADAQFGSFAGFVPVVFPLVAVLITTHIAPASARSRLITLAALIEYAVSALFGVVCMFAAFVGTVESGTFSSVRAGFENFLRQLVQLAVLAAVGYLLARVWKGMYAVPRPVTPQGYGQPYAPAGYGQPGAPAGYGQPLTPGAYPTPGHGVSTQAYGQPYPGYGYPVPSPSGFPPPGTPSSGPLHAETTSLPTIPPAPAAPGSPAGGQPEQHPGDQPGREQSGGDQRPI